MNATMIDGPRLAGRIAVVTGAGGLGLEAATALAAEGAEVILAGRNPGKGADGVRWIQDAWSGARARFELLDLASLRSVAEFTERLQASVGRVDLLVNNAGVMSPPARETTADGFELQFGVNYLGHFALTGRLLPLLRRSASPRVVSVTSLAHRYATMDFDDLQSQRRYRPGRAYCQSKLAQALFAVELQRRSDRAGWGLTSLAAHPGYAGTDLFQNGPGARSLSNLLSRHVVIPLIGQSAKAGAQPILFAATSDSVAGGALYGPTGFLEMKGPPGRRDFAAPAKDPQDAVRLWGVSEELAQVRF